MRIYKTNSNKISHHTSQGIYTRVDIKFVKFNNLNHNIWHITLLLSISSGCCDTEHLHYPKHEAWAKASCAGDHSREHHHDQHPIMAIPRALIGHLSLRLASNWPTRITLTLAVSLSDIILDNCFRHGVKSLQSKFKQSSLLHQRATVQPQGRPQPVR